MKYIKISSGLMRYEWNERHPLAQCQNHPEARMTMTEAYQFAAMERDKIPTKKVGSAVYSIEGLSP